MKAESKPVVGEGGGVIPKVVLRSAFVSRQKGQEMAEEKAGVASSVLRRRTFYFQQRTGRLDLRRINRIDVERVVEDVDIDTLQQHIENLAFSNLEEDDLRIYSDECFLKLFRISQLTIEYLLSVQDTLADSLETLAKRHAELQAARCEVREQLHTYADTEKHLRSEIRQKRKTIAKFEQLLAVPGGMQREGPANPACLSCGKLFSTEEYLQEHISRKHGEQSKAKKVADEEVPLDLSSHSQQQQIRRLPQEQLTLCVQTPKGSCVEIFVGPSATVARVKEHMSDSGLRCTSRHRLLHRGVALEDEITLAEAGITSNTVLLLLPPEDDENSEERGPPQAMNRASGEGTAEHMKALIGLVQQLLQNAELSSRGGGEMARALEMEAADAIEHRIREMTTAMPSTIAAAVEDGMQEVKDALTNVMSDIDAHKKRSAAGDMEDDWNGAGSNRQDLSNLLDRVNELDRSVQRLSSEEQITQSISSHRVYHHAPHRPAYTSNREGEGGSAGPVSTASAATKLRRRSHGTEVSARSSRRPVPGEGQWVLEFDLESPYQYVAVLVEDGMLVEDVSTAISRKLGIEEPRVALTIISTRSIVPPAKPASLLRAYWESGNLTLNIIQGHVISDEVVDDIMEVYEKNVPVRARKSVAFQDKLEETEKRVLSPTRRRSLEQDALGSLGESKFGESSYEETFGSLDWNRTAETDISIPDDALRRADHYEREYLVKGQH